MSAEMETCYNVEMLDRHFVVKKGIVGVDSDSKDFEGCQEVEAAKA